MEKLKKRIKNIPNTEKYLIVIILLYSLVVSAINPSFLSLETLFDICRSWSGMFIIAIGTLVVMISGGIDVSSTAVAIVSAHITVRLIIAWNIDNVLVTIIMVIFFGGVMGLINACLVQLLKVEPFIITLGTGNVFFGLSTMLLGAIQIPGAAIGKKFAAFGSDPLLTVTMTDGTQVKLTKFVVIVLIVVLITWFFLRRTTVGRGIFAMGCSEEAAKRVGYNTFFLKVMAYVYAGALAGVMGMVSTWKVNQLTPISLIGDELTIIAAVVIGGTLPSGGRGKIFGAFLGILVMAIFDSTLVLIGLSSSWKLLFTGVVLLISICATSYQQRVKNRKNFIFTE